MIQSFPSPRLVASYYLSIAGGRITGLIPFPMVLVLCEMQSASSRIWTRVAVSISYDDKHCTTGTGVPVVFNDNDTTRRLEIKYSKEPVHSRKEVQWAVISTAYNSNLQYSWYYLPTPPLGQDMTQGQFLSGV